MASRSKRAQPRKRSQPLVHNTIPRSSQDRDNEYICPICFETIDEPYMTKCGHSFCHKCLKNCLEFDDKCPRCGTTKIFMHEIFPNLTLNEILQKHKERLKETKRLKLPPELLKEDLEELIGGADSLKNMARVNLLIEVLAKQKHKMEGEMAYADAQTLKEFLDRVKAEKKAKLEELKEELDLVEYDLERVNDKLYDIRDLNPFIDSASASNGIDVTIANDCAEAQDGFNGSKNGSRPWLQTNIVMRRQKINSHFEDLQTSYFQTRKSAEEEAQREDGTGDGGLGQFSENLAKFTRFSQIRVLASMHYASDMYNNTSIVSSIEFDRDADFFACAGVTRKIKVFEYQSVIKEHVDMHFPVHEMNCTTKISSVIWSTYQKNLLASSDYDGAVTLWDAFVGSRISIFQEHEKRCWSVDFNHKDPKLLASGSDDSKVKLWNINMEHSVASISAHANVCCVKFNPDSRFHLAFGCADHSVHYYDLRNTKQPLNIFKGHRKAVSYAKFLNANQMVSCSTDSQLKLWNLDTPTCKRTFTGHYNEKNFVGLATDGDYIACGSENNSLYVYYRGLSQHILTQNFETIRNLLDKEKKGGDEYANEFVSAVCWRPNSDVIVAANSQGLIKVLELA